ncbi:MAG: EVE domain-containing protein [Hydrocarboniphaga sp.]|nr:EVE domain-containing protein [Hydrocarboniphaga sp.]MDZ4079396.1 EVE domain-containing protein [Hydrocarboniphaga sp.]
MATQKPSYWLMKSEPDAFSIDDLEKRPKQTEPWNGVRNYQLAFSRQLKASNTIAALRPKANTLIFWVFSISLRRLLSPRLLGSLSDPSKIRRNWDFCRL